MLHCEVMPRAGSSRLGIESQTCVFRIACVRPTSGNIPGEIKKIVESMLFGRFRQQQSQKCCFVNPSWLEMRRRKHKVVTSRHRRGVEAISKADSFHDTLPLELAVRAGLSSKTKHLALDRIRPYPSPTPSITVAARRGASVAFEPYRRRCKSSPWRGVPHVQQQPALTRRSRSDC